MATPTSEDGTPERLLDDVIEPFLEQLRDAGYAERTLRKKRTVTKAFARWVKRKPIAMADLNDGHVAAFVARSPRKRKAHVKFELAVLRLFFRYLRAEAGLPWFTQAGGRNGGTLAEPPGQDDREAAEEEIHAVDADVVAEPAVGERAGGAPEQPGDQREHDRAGHERQRDQA